MKVVDGLLGFLKKVLVRFRNAKFGLLFFVNIFKLPDFFADKRVSIISKLKVVFSLSVGVIYMVSGIDFIPEMVVGLFGLIDDALVVLWSLGIVSEEIEKYKKIIKEDEDVNIIKDVKFRIKDEKEQ